MTEGVGALTAPTGWINWQAFLAGRPAGMSWEVPLYSDARFSEGGIGGLGPYEILNAVSQPEGGFRPTLFLRYAEHAGEGQLPSALEKSQIGAYHGGTLDEEIAALLSLAFGARLRAGSPTRWFPPGKDPRGEPVDWDWGVPNLPEEPRRPRIPRARGWTGAIGTSVLPLSTARGHVATYPSLSPGAAVAFVRAARQYQEGLWVAEVDPELTWLKFVGAVETAALFHDSGSLSPVANLEASLPELADLIRPAGAEVLAQAAEMLDGRLGKVTARFADFVVHFDPGPPADRPDRPDAQVDWTELRRLVTKVYDWRSKALHRGLPIPLPMLAPPGHYGGPGRDERVTALAEGTEGAMWTRDDIPMRLHVFEHITRGCLLNWWASMAPGTGAQAIATER